ncbi:MAG: hypothetical protein EOP88_15330 [Verrucomicrobiaceae bacterium]|nr:MAG: hypothetical protein EOP88_15330 [Verrucomicrobiaceae bacterium]
MEPVQALSNFCYICGVLLIPVAGLLVFIFKRRWDRAYDRAVDSSPDEILAEIDREFTLSRKTTIRTQTEYLPFLFESIRENIDSGFEDPQVISLLNRIETHRPGEKRSAVFSVMTGKKQSDIHMQWVRDSCDRIQLHIQGAPVIIRALRQHQLRIPRAIA